MSPLPTIAVLPSADDWDTRYRRDPRIRPAPTADVAAVYELAESAMRISQAGWLDYMSRRAVPREPDGGDPIGVPWYEVAIVDDLLRQVTPAGIASRRRLEDLLSHCTVDPADGADIRATLEARPKTVRLLLAMQAEVTRRFGDSAGLDLSVGFDEQGDGRLPVTVFVRFGEKSEAKQIAFEAFRHQWWYPRVPLPEYGVGVDYTWR